MPSTYEPKWPPRYATKCLTRLRQHGVDLGEDEDTFMDVCDSIQALSARVRDEGLVLGGKPNPLIDDMAELEAESLRVFQGSGHRVTADMWPRLSALQYMVAAGVIGNMSE